MCIRDRDLDAAREKAAGSGTVSYTHLDVYKRQVKHNANGIYLFGSVARGDDNSQSDIDFIVDFPKIYDLFRDRLALANALEDLFGRKIDLIVKDELNKEIAMSAYKDAILL